MLKLPIKCKLDQKPLHYLVLLELNKVIDNFGPILFIIMLNAVAESLEKMGFCPPAFPLTWHAC